jgi:multicomponent Na+:H+ antiporter subunit G
MIDVVSSICLGVGVFFWWWGTAPLVGRHAVIVKLHRLSVSDTLGSMVIMLGLLLKIPREWPLLLLGILSLAVWNTALGYVLAYCSTHEDR